MTLLKKGTSKAITRKILPLSIFQRIAEQDKNAVKECVESYDNFIWALARKFTSSNLEAEEVTRTIFIDIWQFANQCTDYPPTDEEILIALIARRRLMKQLH